MIASLVIGLVTVALAGSIAFATARAESRAALRDRERVSYLTAAYRRLAQAANRPYQGDNPQSVQLEDALQDVQLLGTSTQVALAQEFMRAFSAGGEACLDDLLVALRDSLRAELSLQPVPSAMLHLRPGPRPDGCSPEPQRRPSTNSWRRRRLRSRRADRLVVTGLWC